MGIYRWQKASQRSELSPVNGALHGLIKEVFPQEAALAQIHSVLHIKRVNRLQILIYVETIDPAEQVSPLQLRLSNFQGRCPVTSLA